MMPELHLIIVAAGKGERFGEKLPKQFVNLGGQPLLFHTFKAFAEVKNLQYTLVLNTDYIEFWKELCRKHGFSVPHKIVKGGETRFHSVKNALKQIPDNTIVIIHDGVRPFPSNTTIRSVIDKAMAEGNGVPVIEETEAVRIIYSKTSKSVDRNIVRKVQTPQAYASTELKKAYDVDFQDIFIDEAVVFENAGNKINLVQGNYENIKITFNSDHIIAEQIITSMKSFP